jgi:hypothetical protein
METGKINSAGGALFELLRTSISPDGANAFGHLVLYTSFGVVRGRTGLAFLQGLNHEEENRAVEESHPVIELNEVSVEHYSNHLPTASFDRLYVRIADIQGFALESG